jgi:hypothetical protein
MQRHQSFFCIWAIISIALLSSPSRAEGLLPKQKLYKAQDIERYYTRALKGEQVVLLSNDLEQFYALTIEQRTAEPKGGLLILHDTGHSPDWPYLLQQTRNYLPDVGWSTLSIDLPTPQRDATGRLAASEDQVIDAEETYEQWQARVLERIATGITTLNNDGLLNLAIIGYGDGGYWASRYLAERITPEEEAAYALILVDVSLQYDTVPDYIGQLNISMLDLYMDDSDFAHRRAKDRKAAAQRNKAENYTQIHDAARQATYGNPDIDRSTRRVWGWLRSNASGGEANVTERGAP